VVASTSYPNFRLTKEKLVDAKSGYRKFLRAVALDVANRGERREIQLKEIARLKAILKTLKKHGEYLEQQTNEFKSYLKALKKTAFEVSLHFFELLFIYAVFLETSKEAERIQETFQIERYPQIHVQGVG